MKRSLFYYDCPVELIAQEPAQKRDESRLLVFHNSEITDRTFFELPNILENIFSLNENKKCLLIGNNSKVYPARLKVYRKTGARCEIFVLEVEEKEFYSCLIRQKAKIKENEILYLDQNLTTPIFEVIDLENPKIKPLFSESMADFLHVHGSTPLPPYIKRKNEDNNKQTKDKSRYQNVYANNNNLGSSAAPTAGFHFTPEIIASLPKFNIDIDYVTLHVGLGTFLPVKSENITEHFMHTEHYCLSASLVKKIFYYLENNWPIVFIGTTSLRSTESFFRKVLNEAKEINPQNKEYVESALAYADKWHSTNLFLYPENETERRLPLVGNGIITNFHQSESSLLMLVASIMGFQNLKKIYGHALEQQYRFFSYGDSSLLVF